MAPAPSDASTGASTRSSTFSSEWHETAPGGPASPPTKDLAQAPRSGTTTSSKKITAGLAESAWSPSSSTSTAAPSPSSSPSGREEGGARRFETDYELLGAVLGVGASGSVKLARCRRTGRHVAVKSFRLKDLPPKTLLNLEREVDVHSSMKHPNIVDLEAVYETEDSVHLVMEQLYGGELFDRLLEVGRFPEEDAASIIAQLLRSVSYLHSRNVMHRDIKPENIMYSKKDGGEIKLIDFGFATRFERHRKVGQRCGTMQYVAPEVLTGQGYDERADMWSLGCVCYTLLTLKALYGGDDAEIQRKNRSGLIDWSRTLQTVSPEAQDFVRSLLRVDPANRLSAEQALRHPWLARHAQGQAAEAALRGGLPPASQRHTLPGLTSALDCALGSDKAPVTRLQRLPRIQESCFCWGAPACFAGIAKLAAPGRETEAGASLFQRFAALMLDSPAAK